MKMKHFLLLLTLFYCNLTFSQERKNLALPKIDKSVIGNILLAKGWLYNIDGQWISSFNKIPYPLIKQSESLQNFEKYSLGTDNFIFFETRKIKIVDSTYIILIKKYSDGYYKYKTIEKGWVPHISYDYYVFSLDDFNKISESKPDIINNLSILNIHYGQVKYLNNNSNYSEFIERNIANLIKENIENKSNHLFLQFINFSKTGVTRFNINNGDIISYNQKEFFQKDIVFEKFYFETKTSSFLSLFKK